MSEGQVPPEAQLGPVHRQLLRFTGEYTTVTRFRNNPAAANIETRGRASIGPILDGRFRLEENSGEMNGQAVSGVRMYGYNTASGHYEGIWTYGLSTAIMRLDGTSPDAGRTIEFDASFEGAGGQHQTFRIVLRDVSDGVFVTELRGPAPGAPVLETVYTRV